MEHPAPSDPQSQPPARWERAVLLAILLFAAISRFWELGGDPPGLNCDEAMIGVAASSLALTGRNIYGESWPLYHHERSFSHWGASAIVTPPIQLYSTVPFVWLMGRTPAAVRAPSVCFALLGILGCYFLGRELLGPRAGLLGAAFLAISPWHYHLSRIGIEPISLSALLTWEAYFLWKGRSSRAHLLAGAASAALATYAYPPGRLFAPLLGLGILIIHRKAFWERRWDLLLAASVALLLVLPNVYLLLSQESQGRMYSLLLWTAEPSDLDREAAIRFLRRNSDVGAFRLLYAFAPLKCAYLFTCTWLRHYFPTVLFVERSEYYQLSPPGQGLLLVLSMPFFLLGVLRCLRTRKEAPSALLLGWLLAFPIPASLTIGSFNTARSVTAFPIPELLSALGLWTLLERPGRSEESSTRPSGRAKLLAGMGLLLGLLGLGEGLGRIGWYHLRYKVEGARYWDHGVREALEQAHLLARSDEPIVISDSIMSGYLFYLFYMDTDYRKIRPDIPDFAGLLPARVLIHGPHSPPPPGLEAIWIIRPEERSSHASGDILARLTYPTGEPNLFLVRDTTK